MAIQSLKPHIGLPPIWDNNPLNIPAPIGAWIINEGSGGAAHDLSGSGNHGTLVDANSEMSWIPGGIEFVGDNISYFAIPTITLTDSEPWTLIVRLQVDAGDNKEAIPLGTAGNPNDYFWFNEGSYIRFRNSAGTNLNIGEITSFTDMNTFAFVADGAGNLDTYQNGNFIVRDSATTSFIFDSIGYAFNSPDYQLDGRIEHVRLYNNNLSAAQVQHDYMNPYYAWDYLDDTLIAIIAAQVAVSGRIMSSLVGAGGLAGMGGIAGQGGGLAA